MCGTTCCGRYNQLTALPSSYAKLTGLTNLVLSGNAFSAVPEPVFSMASLQWLWLSNNRISVLPVERLESLRKLQSLHVNDNLLTTIDVLLPDSLLELDISNNAISALPLHFSIPNGAEVR